LLAGLLVGVGMWLAISHFICNDDDGNSGKSNGPKLLF
jgi:hypothetical protein